MSAKGAGGALRFQIGARTLASIPRRLVRISWSLADVLAGAAPPMPPLEGADGWLVTSLPEAVAIGQFVRALDGRNSVRAERSRSTCICPSTSLRANGNGEHVAHVRQRYTRYWTDLTIGHDAWQAGLSANTRAGLKRKARKLVAIGRMEIRSYRDAAGLAEFHALARPLSALTYQERLLGSGLPDTPAFHAAMLAAGATDAARAWLLLIDDRPVAYLYGSERDGALLYEHVGHDPAWGALSPGTVLHAHAFADLFAERRFARFDFTEGEGQHKRQFATGGVACVDLLLLRPTLANRTAIAALAAWDGAMAGAKRWVRHPALKRVADQVRR